MNEDIIKILDPAIISESQDIIQSLAREGLDHLTSDPKLGWNYVLDHVWITKQIEQYIKAKKQRSLTILDVGCGRSRFHNFIEKRFGINIVGIDRPQGYCHQDQSENIDYYVDFLQLNAFPENSVDIIYWLSAIEHNEKENIRQLFQKSMSLLKEGGLFLATFAVSEETHWFQDSEQTNLSIADSTDIFDIENAWGDLQFIKEKYRQNILLLRDKYEKRYRGFGANDPDFVVAAVRKLKAKTRAKALLSQAAPQDQPYLYLFVPSNDTHVHWMYPLAKVMEKSRFMVISEKNEKAEFYLDNLGEKFLVYKSGILEQVKPNVLVFGCDWGGYEQQIIKEAKILGIPTVCIQEGCLDFMDRRVNRMLHADYAFLQGPVMRKYIHKENNVFATGNPKYDSLYETPLPDKVTVMINSNFTYGIFEQARDQWVRNVAETCKCFGLDFFISQHPRDRGVFPSDYRVIKSDAFKLSRQLEKTSILVSRFSTVIYEAAAMGREVVYYNPHHEPFRIFAQDTTGGIRIANNRTELTKAIQSAVLNPGTNNENRRKFLQQHCDSLNHDAAIKCSEHLQAIAQKHFYTEQSKHDRLNLSGIHAEPLVSVIMPAYNAAEYIAAAIKSVLSQDYRNFELIIINDGSTDDTEKIIHDIKDDRIRYFRQENQGLAATHNTGIRQSQGEFIVKLDADDKMTPDFIARHLQEFEKHPEADLVYCDDRLIGSNDMSIRIISRPEYTDRKLLIRDMFRCGYPIVPFRTCIRRSVFDKIGFFDESLPVGEDYDMMRRFIKHGLKMRHLPSALYLRRMTESSLSRNLTPQKAKCQFELVKRFTETFRHDELFPDVEWDEMPANKIQLHAKCLAVVTYLAIGQDYLNSHSSGFYAKTAFDNACTELRNCLKIDPANHQIQELLRKCELGGQRYEKHSKQAVR